jgi:hypothetical protein
MRPSDCTGVEVLLETVTRECQLLKASTTFTRYILEGPIIHLRKDLKKLPLPSVLVGHIGEGRKAAMLRLPG